MNILDTDLQHNWHPCTQMKDFEIFPPLHIQSAQGPDLTLSDGRVLIDAISSWWCKSLGHRHPALQAALQKQMATFEHVIFANTTFEAAAYFAEALTRLTDPLSHIFYASDGSSAVEIALKMSLHARWIQGDTKRTTFMALENSYHGETLLALSLSDVSIYRRPYTPLLTDYPFLKGIPYVSGPSDPLWHDCSRVWPELEAQLDPYEETLSALILEPIVQGAGGMRMYSPDCLKRLRAWTAARGIHLIADEIMTGCYRTGPAFAYQHAGITPDFLCLGKGLTGGMLPLAVTLTHPDLYALFYDDFEKGQSFLHSHTHSGNALCLSVAHAALQTFETEHIPSRLPALQSALLHTMQTLADETGHLQNVRALGGIAAAEWVGPSPSRFSFRFYQAAVEAGALLRPIGHTLYFLPPLNLDLARLDELERATRQALSSI